MDAITAAYMSAQDRMGAVSLDDFRKSIEGCSVYPVSVGGNLAGAVIVKGCEVHACILPWAHKRWFGRPQARILNDVIRRYGYATTKATTGAGRDFVERLGFKKTGDGYRKEVPYGH
jgi:hypothetical protein